MVVESAGGKRARGGASTRSTSSTITAGHCRARALLSAAGQPCSATSTDSPTERAHRITGRRGTSDRPRPAPAHLAPGTPRGNGPLVPYRLATPATVSVGPRGRGKRGASGHAAGRRNSPGHYRGRARCHGASPKVAVIEGRTKSPPLPGPPSGTVKSPHWTGSSALRNPPAEKRSCPTTGVVGRLSLRSRRSHTMGPTRPNPTSSEFESPLKCPRS